MPTKRTARRGRRLHGCDVHLLSLGGRLSFAGKLTFDLLVGLGVPCQVAKLVSCRGIPGCSPLIMFLPFGGANLARG